jgi:hypothetical protein
MIKKVDKNSNWITWGIKIVSENVFSMQLKE